MNFHSFIAMSLTFLLFNDNPKIYKLFFKPEMCGVSVLSAVAPWKKEWLPLLLGDLKIQVPGAGANKLFL